MHIGEMPYTNSSIYQAPQGDIWQRVLTGASEALRIITGRTTYPSYPQPAPYPQGPTLPSGEAITSALPWVIGGGILLFLILKKK